MLKRIKTQAQVEKEKKRNQVVIGVVLIGLMLLSTIGYSVFSGDGATSSGETVEEEEMEFTNVGGFWKTDINGIDFGFQYLPSEVKDVPVTTYFRLNDYTGAVVYFVNSKSIAAEILNNLNPYVLRYQEACLEGEACENNLPVKNCSEKLIVYKEGNETRVYQKDNCIYIIGDAVKAADAFLYKILDIN